MKTMYFQKGLSIMELLMGLATVSIMITVGAPAITESQRLALHKGAVETSYFTLQSGRASAISSRQDTTVSFNTVGDWCIGLSDAGQCDCQTAMSCTIDGVENVMDQRDFKSIALQEVDFSGNNFTVFDSQRGLALNNAGSFVFSDGNNNEVRVEVNNMGRVRICVESGQLSGYSAC